jgi:radical SAM superfamily enzyme YgiQ (UPF0313 family)
MKTLLLAPPSLRLMNPATFEPDLLPPKTWVPLGIASLAAALRAHGFEAEFHDLHDRTWEEVERIIRGSGAGMVGVSCFTFGRGNALKTAALARSALPDALVVMGGPHATLFPGQMLSGGHADAVVLGEGEGAIVDIARRLELGRPMDDVPGLALPREEGIRRTPPREAVADLDQLPFPDYDAFDISQYKSPEVPPQ